jgi:hypothetical protein
MGLRNRIRGDDGHVCRRYRMQEKLLSVGDDYWIEDETGQRVFKVDGKAIRVRDTFVLEDASGSEVAKIQERKLSVRDKMKIEMGDRSATVHKAMVGIRDRYKIDIDGGPGLSATETSSTTNTRSSRTATRSQLSRKAGSGSVTPTASRLHQNKMMRSSSRSPSAWTRWRADSRPTSSHGMTSRDRRPDREQIEDAFASTARPACGRDRAGSIGRRGAGRPDLDDLRAVHLRNQQSSQPAQSSSARSHDTQLQPGRHLP